MRGLLAACLLVLSFDAARAQSVQTIEITEYGVYTTASDASSAAPGTASGKIEQVSNIKLVQSTATVPARVGVEFGFRYKSSDSRPPRRHRKPARPSSGFNSARSRRRHQFRPSI
jgi:hypothetical protein